MSIIRLFLMATLLCIQIPMHAYNNDVEMQKQEDKLADELYNLGRVSEVMLRERRASNRLFFGCEDRRNSLSEVWLTPHQKEWHNSTGQATLSL